MAAVSHARASSPLVRVAGIAATAAGWLTGRTILALPSVPGLAGAALVSLGAGEVASHVFGHGLAPWVTVLVAGGFGLLRDRRI